jgi:hypothetical protein
MTLYRLLRQDGLNLIPTQGYWDTVDLPDFTQVTIIGQIMHPHNRLPWAGAKIHWRFAGPTTTANTQRPSDCGTITADSNGQWTVDLWANSEGDRPSLYHFKFPNSTEIPIYIGDQTPSPIEFSALAIAQTPPTAPTYPALVELINSMLAGLGASSDLLINSAVTLSGHKVVLAGATGVAPASSTNFDHANRAIGITTGASSLGQTATVRREGEMTEPSWAWALGPVYLGADGALVQPAPSAGFVQEVAIALTPSKILVNIRPSYQLA